LTAPERATVAEVLDEFVAARLVDSSAMFGPVFSPDGGRLAAIVDDGFGLAVWDWANSDKPVTLVDGRRRIHECRVQPQRSAYGHYS
jgi:hypothetical protein